MNRRFVLSVSLATLVLASVWGRPPEAEADCVTLPQCDELAPECTYCPPDEEATHGYSAEGSDIFSNFSESPGGRRGMDVTHETVSRLIGKTDFEDTPEVSDSEWGALVELAEDQANGEFVPLPGQTFDSGYTSGQDAEVDVFDPNFLAPTDQAGRRVPRPSGVPDNTPAAADKSDPVNPQNGEFYIESVDLAFPGFGIPYRHLRTYRSRVDYDGPLGYGWDHLYNQRLVALEPAFELPTVPVTPVYDEDPATPSPVEYPQPPGVDGDCGPELMLTTGRGTTLRFREIARTDQEIHYSSDGVLLTLTGDEAGDGGVSWTLTSPQGDARHFDEHGLLVRWEDANGVGLDIAWEPGASRLDWRVVQVVDSVGRIIRYEYDADDRLVRVSDDGSGLTASYEYDGHGDLYAATDSGGRSQYYEYDVDTSREDGAWLSEWQLDEACELACAPSSSSCDAGGACDQPVEDAMAECLGSCNECSDECSAQCPDTCDTVCREGDLFTAGCAGQCEADCDQGLFDDEIQETCQSAWESGVSEVCAGCEDVCNRESSGCHALGNCLDEARVTVSSDSDDDGNAEVDVTIAGDCLDENQIFVIGDTVSDFIVTSFAAAFEAAGCVVSAALCSWQPLCEVDCDWSWTRDKLEELCNQHYDTCCEDGTECGSQSCNAGRSCFDDCQAAFFGSSTGNQCVAFATAGGVPMPPLPDTPAYGTPAYDDLIDEFGSVDEWAAEHGCLPSLQRECPAMCTRTCVAGCSGECIPQCESTCDEECHVGECADYCESIDLMGECQSGCVAGCVDASHEAGPFVGPKYGQRTDLNHNIVRVYDGNGELYLENVYGQDIGRPDFDSVIEQRYGDHVVEMYYRDLEAEEDGSVPEPVGPAAAFIEDRADYESVDICPRDCEPGAGGGLEEFVPWKDEILVFEQPADAKLGGWQVLELDRPSARRSRSGGSAGLSPRAYTARKVRNGILLEPLAEASGSPASLDVSTPHGRLELGLRQDGSYLAQGTRDAMKALARAGVVTMLTDREGSVRLYPALPRSVLHVTSGSCNEPFTAQQTSSNEIQLSPADACSNTLLVSPLASVVTDRRDTDAYRKKGDAVFDGRNMYRGALLAPARQAVLWSEGASEGRFGARRSSSDSAADRARDAALSSYASVPLFTGNDTKGAPVYVFHIEPDEERSASFSARRRAGPTLPDGDNDASTPGLPVDRPLPDTPPDEAYQPPCDPDRPSLARRGTGANAPGPRPAHATVLVDFHGVPWTYYFDERGRTIRTVNHDTGAVRSFNFDSIGLPVAVEDPLGGRVCTSWDGAGNPTEILQMPAPDQLGSTTPIRQRIDYTDFPYRPETIYDPRDGDVLSSYSWDENGNLLAVTNADGDTITYDLVGGDGPERAMPYRTTAPDGSVTELEYDLASGAMHRIIRDANGTYPAETELVHDAAGHTVWAKTPLGEILTWDWRDGRLRSFTRNADGLFEFAEYSYDADGQVIAVNRGDRTTSYVYDAIGNVQRITETVADGSIPPRTTCIASGPDGRTLEVVAPEGTRTRYAYDGEGRIVRVESGALPASSGGWDDACAAPGSDLLSATATTFEATYDLAGRPATVTDAQGITTTYWYDGFHRPVEVERGTLLARTGFDALGNPAWQAAYDAHAAVGAYSPPWWGQPGLLAASQQDYDEVGRLHRSRTWHFDEQGQAVGDGYATTTLDYDPATSSITVTDDAGEATTQYLDGIGRTVRTVLPNGAEIVTEYRDGGRTVVRERPAPTPGGLAVQILERTAWGAPVRLRSGDGQTLAPMATWSYDDHRRLTERWSSGGGSVALQYDAFDRPTRRETTYSDGSSEVARMLWSANGWLRELESDSGTWLATTVFHRDTLGRVRRRTDPDGSHTDMTYTGARSVPSIVYDPAGYEWHHAYDANGHLARIRTVSPATGDIDQWREFMRDPLGRIDEAFHKQAPDWEQDAIHTYFAWDSLGNKLSESDDSFGPAGAVAHTYDGRSLPVDSTIAGTPVQRTFDDLGRLTDLFTQGEHTAHLDWPTLGPPLARTLATGVETTYEYDAFERLAGVSDIGPGGQGLLAQQRWHMPRDGVPRLASFYGAGLAEEYAAYRTDAGGRLIVEAYGGSAPTVPPLKTAADTDTANAWADQLLAQATQQREYQLDGRHNWLSVTRNGETIAPALGADDAFLSFGSVEPTYDARGALLSDGERAYAYNSFGELTEVQSGEASRQYVRDAFGRVVVERDLDTGEETRIAYDGPRRVAIEDPDGDVEVHIGGPGIDEHLLRLMPDGSRQYYHQDRTGNVYLVSDQDGQPLEWYRYTAYGETSILSPDGQLLATSAIGNRFTFQGQLEDHALGLIDMRARSYLPSWGRFVSRDPLGLLAGPNRYAFVGSAPLLWTDPLGLDKVSANERCKVNCHQPNGGWPLNLDTGGYLNGLGPSFGFLDNFTHYGRAVVYQATVGTAEFAIDLVTDPSGTIEGVGDGIGGLAATGYAYVLGSEQQRQWARENVEAALEASGCIGPGANEDDCIESVGSFVGAVASPKVVSSGGVRVANSGVARRVRARRGPTGRSRFIDDNEVLSTVRGGSANAARVGIGTGRRFIRGTRGLRHSFDRHAAEWFGRRVRVDTHLDSWEQIVQRAAHSQKQVDWTTGADATVGHLARIDGKYFFAQFYKDGPRAGELATAFIPSQRQLTRILEALRK